MYGYNHNEKVYATHSSLLLLLLPCWRIARSGKRERESFVYTHGPVRSLLNAYSLTYLGRSWTFFRGDIGEREVSYKLAL